MIGRQIIGAAARRPGVVVQITHPEPVRYSRDNGITLTQYEPQELYDVPEYVAKGLIGRGWARAVTGAELETADAKPDGVADLGEVGSVISKKTTKGSKS